jgi:hypothetical protein
MEFLMDLITIVVIAVIAMWVGWHLRGIVILANLAEDPDRVISMLEKIKKINEEEQNEQVGKLTGVEIKPELVGNVWYAYAADNDQFLGQGPTLEAALKMVADRFPNKKFWCKKPDGSNQTT